MARKRIKINPKFRSKKGDDNRISLGDDRLSQLPDEILIDILSFLPVKEAARTTVLSPRWVNLWNYSSCLDFDAESTLYKIGRRKRLRTSERRKYVKWVSYVIESNKATSLTEFRICFDLTNSSQQTITEWLEFAFSKQVQKLKVDLSPYTEGWNCPAKTCNFPDSLLNRSVVDYKPLKSLCLKYVGVSDEAIGFVLQNCPLLEKLVIHNSQKMTKLEVSSLVLRHLEICYCYRLKSMKVSAPNLTSLYVMILDGLVLESVPMLVDLFVACWFSQIYSKNLRPTISCCISQLEALSLLLDNSEASIELCKLPEMPKLKKLSVTYGSTSDESFLGLTSLIRASPHIKELVLKLRWLELARSDENTVKFRHQHLKVLKVCGYSGQSSDVDLVNYFLENCVALQRIIIFPQYPRPNPYAPIPPAKVVAEKKARTHAQQHLQAQVPNHIKLFIQ